MRCANKVRNINTSAQLKKQLWSAVELNAYEKVADALAAGAPIDARDEYGHTPLLWATDHGRSKIAILLLACGANTNIQPKGAKTKRSVAHYAKVRNNKELLGVLSYLGMDTSAA
jgi:ankyrin repeat protein